MNCPMESGVELNRLLALQIGGLQSADAAPLLAGSALVGQPE